MVNVGVIVGSHKNELYGYLVSELRDNYHIFAMKSQTKSGQTPQFDCGINTVCLHNNLSFFITIFFLN